MNISFVLQNLIEEYNISPIELSRRSKVPQPTVHRLLNGLSKKPNNATSEALCNFFKLTRNQLLGLEPIYPQRSDKNHKYLPLLEWADVLKYQNNCQDKKFYRKTVLTEDTIAEKSFAVILDDSSMEPLFSPGTILIFDPFQDHRDRRYVIAFLKAEERAMFRQLIMDGNSRFLKALNPDISSKTIKKLTEDDLILGVLTQAKKDYLE